MEKPDPRRLSHHIPCLWRRAYAFYIDEGLRLTFYFPFLILMAGETGLFGDPEISRRALILAVLTSLSFRVVCLYLLGGTVGKLTCGLRLVDRRTGGPLTFGQTLVRVVADELAVFFAFAPRALAYFRWDRMQLSDLLAETRVISLKEQHFFPERRPVFGAILVILGIYWGATAWL